MMKPEECGMCIFFQNGEDYDFCSLKGERRECYEEACEDGEADA